VGVRSIFQKRNDREEFELFREDNSGERLTISAIVGRSIDAVSE